MTSLHLSRLKTWTLLAALCAFVCLSVQIAFMTYNEGHDELEAANVQQSGGVLIVGAAGFIGSRLHAHLSGTFRVVGIDRAPLPERKWPGVEVLAAKDLPASILQRFDAVVYLGGLTGRSAADAVSADVCERENVADVVDLARRMGSHQVLIASSTSAIAEGLRDATETQAGDEYLMDRYTHSMLRRERALAALPDYSSPKRVILRLGTVIGVSPSQRTTMVHMALVRSAFTTGRMSMMHGETRRPILSMDDLLRAIEAILLRTHLREKFEIYNLMSFNTTIRAVAHAVAAQTGALVDGLDHIGSDIDGFSLDCSKFKEHYNFDFRVDMREAVASLIQHAPHVSVGRNLTVPGCSCAVCGSRDVVSVLDLGLQPLANDFRGTADAAEQCERFPLHLVRCRKCNHIQLSTVVNRQTLFDHYLYKSGTSATLRRYFGWVARKVTNELTGGDVIEIACNDGSQLDEFRKLGWRTYGVDPARNIAEVALSKGHTIEVDYWTLGKQYPLLPRKVRAIVAQNVLAHVPSPVEFLRACVPFMSASTLLYVQTSQCEMFELGQFDTVYHEHVSFFTAHSFKHAAELAGLVIINYEITPIHGSSCLLTLALPAHRGSTHSVSLNRYLDREVSQGRTQDWYYAKYRAQAVSMRQWMDRTMSGFRQQGYVLGAFGAAAKGIVLMHYMHTKPDFVVDDAPLKQNTFCPGTRVPVKSSDALAEYAARGNLALVVYAWNFYDEIASKVLRHLQRDIYVILPFPRQRVVRLFVNGNQRTVTAHHFAPVPWPAPFDPFRQPVVFVVHITRPSLAWLPLWIQHHASQTDYVVLITCGHSVDHLGSLLPPGWEVRSEVCDASESSRKDVEEMVLRFPKAWILKLTTSDFLMHSNLRRRLAQAEKREVTTLSFDDVVVPYHFPKAPPSRFQHPLLQATRYRTAPSDSRRFLLSRASSEEQRSVQNVTLGKSGFVACLDPALKLQGSDSDFRSVDDRLHEVWYQVTHGTPLFPVSDTPV